MFELTIIQTLLLADSSEVGSFIDDKQKPGHGNHTPCRIQYLKITLSKIKYNIISEHFITGRHSFCIINNVTF